MLDKVREQAVVARFAGDSGDGVQVLGTEFAKSSALSGHDMLTFPDFPAEIRAPAGTTFGVSAYQIQFGGSGVRTPGDEVDILIVFNPAALKTNLHHLKTGGLVILDDGAFGKKALEKAGYEADPREDDTLANYRVLRIDITARCEQALAELGVGKRQSDRSKNFWVLGLLYFIYEQEREPTLMWLADKFAKKPEVAAANQTALNAGHAYAETAELSADLASRPVHADIKPGLFRPITGTEAMSLGFAAVAATSGLKINYCSYPITPASALLHALAAFRGSGVVTFQAEDEIAAVCAAIGASYTGSLGVTGSSGPGVALMAESIALAAAAELPLLVIDVQRAGPSTGMPTKAEQADLTMAVHGRHGESPCPVLAPATPGECFDVILEAARIAVRYMTPVIVLSDAYLANAAEHWLVPDVDHLEPIAVNHHTDPDDFHPFLRDDENLSRPWVKPGTPRLTHRIGGIERAYNSGHISYDPDNHHKMTETRAAKVERIAENGDPIGIDCGADSGDVLVIGWGSTYGSIRTAVEALHAAGHSVGHLHLRQLFPFPNGFEEILRRFKKCLVIEMNTGQLRDMVRSTYLIPAEGLNQVSGQLIKVAAIKDKVMKLL